MTKEKLKRILEAKIDCNMWAVLYLFSQAIDLSDIEMSKVEGWKLLLNKKGFINSDCSLTELGKSTLQSIEGTKEEPKKILDLVGESKISIPKGNVTVKGPFEGWTEGLLNKLKAKLKDVINKDQIMGFGNVYFIPNIHDLRDHLQRFNKKYKMSLQDNSEKIEKILVKHVETCARKRSFAPAVKYFIIKDKTGSQLATALDNYTDGDEENTEFKSEIII